MESLIKKIDKKIGRLGMPEAMRQLLLACGTGIKTNTNKELRNILKNKAVLILANHPAEADVPVLLAALENRRDLYVIANSSFNNIGENIDKHIIPVHINHRLYGAKGFDLIKLKLLRLFNKTEFLEANEAHQKNIESINLAANKVAQGSLVVLYPQGGSSDGSWFSGVGYLIKNIGKREGACVIMAHIKGTSNKDYLRLVPGISKLLPQIEVDFSPAKEIEQLVDYEPKVMTKILESEYKLWVEKKESKIEAAAWWEKVNLGIPKNIYLVMRTLVLWISIRIG